MEFPELTLAAENDVLPANLAEVGIYPTFGIGSDHGLVVLAMGLAYWLVPAGNGFALLVEPESAVAVREQLARFDRESVGWPPPHPEAGLPARPVDLATPLVWAALIVGAYRLQAAHPSWVEATRLDATAVFARGEIWRAATALFLHADAGHLVSNLLSGLFVFATVNSTLGRARGWLLVTLAAIAANLLSAASHYPEPYLSVGASTLIFAGVGLLTGRAARIAASASRGRRWQTMFAPLASGLTVLGLYGAGGQRVDLGAHLYGFLMGLVLGLALRPPGPSSTAAT
jgi:rhomboid protease GluP